jgi:hypothetical protein
MWRIEGNPWDGYRLCDPNGEPSMWHFAMMWDAINAKDAINRGEIKPSSEPLQRPC